MSTKQTSDNSDGKVLLYLIAGVLLAAVLFVGSCVIHQQKVELMDTFTASSPGTVTRVESYRKRRNKHRITAYRYYVSFKDSDGVAHEGESLAQSERRPVHSEGDSVTVRYDPMKIDDACVIAGDEDLV